MGRHSSGPRVGRWLLPLAVVIVAAGLVFGITLVKNRDRDGGKAAPDPTPASPCRQELRVVTASSFAPVLTALAPELGRAENCVQLIIETVNGRAAAARLAQPGVDLWIPDDISWGPIGGDSVAPAGTVGSGTILATSPFYMVTDRATADEVSRVGGSWLGLANLLTGGSRIRLAIRDPAGSGDGMVGAGAVGEAVWIDKGMDASALALTKIKEVTRTVGGAEPALPKQAGEVGLVPEYALLESLTTPGAELAVLAGRDHTPMLRYAWLPTTAAVQDPVRADAMGRLLDTLTGAAGAKAIAAAGLRGPDASTAPQTAARQLPKAEGRPLKVLGPHHVDHVLAIWYAQDRRTSLLIVVDVSGSMKDPAPGSRTPLISLVRSGCRSVGELLPDDARLGLWEFGTELDQSRDYRVMLSMAALSSGHRRAVGSAVGRIAARDTGTGLYDTILAAYTSARNSYQQGMPNQVLIFTDGRNEDDAKTITAAQLSAGLRRAHDPRRPVQLSVVVFGQKQTATLLENALKPVDGYVSSLSTAADVPAVFLHQAAGGIHAQ